MRRCSQNAYSMDKLPTYFPPLHFIVFFTHSILVMLLQAAPSYKIYSILCVRWVCSYLLPLYYPKRLLALFFLPTIPSALGGWVFDIRSGRAEHFANYGDIHTVRSQLFSDYTGMSKAQHCPFSSVQAKSSAAFSAWCEFWSFSDQDSGYRTKSRRSFPLYSLFHDVLQFSLIC